MQKFQYFKEGVDKPVNGEIFVFGSNLAGIHGRGAARTALDEYGAEWKNPLGLQGSSYAIPTKNAIIKPLPIEAVKEFIKHFIAFAKANPDLNFFVTRVGCGLANFDDKTIAPLFKKAPKNCRFDMFWKKYLETDNSQGKKYLE